MYYDCVHANDYDAVLTKEIWLSNKALDNNIALVDYNGFRKDRQTHSEGGCFLYLRDISSLILQLPYRW